MSFRPEVIPLDFLPLILEQLPSRRDLNHCALVNRAFHSAAIPILYRTLDARIRVQKTGGEGRIVHPSSTLLRHPEYARYVRHIVETGTSTTIAPEFMAQCYRALQLCTNLESLSWTGGGFVSNIDSDLVGYVNTIMDGGFPLRDLVVRASPGLSTAGWNQLTRLTSLRSLGIWCLLGEHEALQDWCKSLAGTLAHLELDVGSLSHRYIEYLTHLPRLQSLRLRGMRGPSRNLIKETLIILPSLVDLDVEYYGSSAIDYEVGPPIAELRSLKITTSSVDAGPQEVWPWILELIPRTSLESLTVEAFSAHSWIKMPYDFLAQLSSIHGQTLRKLEAHKVILPEDSLRQACNSFPRLELLACSLPWCTNIDDIGVVTMSAYSLRSLKVVHHSLKLDTTRAERWMLREHSRLRSIEFGRERFRGEWVYRRSEDGAGEARFQIYCDDNKTYNTWI